MGNFSKTKKTKCHPATSSSFFLQWVNLICPLVILVLLEERIKPVTVPFFPFPITIQPILYLRYVCMHVPWLDKLMYWVGMYMNVKILRRFDGLYYWFLNWIIILFLWLNEFSECVRVCNGRIEWFLTLFKALFVYLFQK